MYEFEDSRISRRRFLAVGAGAAASLGIAACGGDDGGSAGPKRGATIVIGMEAGSPHLTFYKRLAPEFTRATGIKTKFVAIPHENMRQQFLTAALSGAGSFDVYTTDQPWIPQFAAAGYLLKLDDRVAAADRDDFLPSALATVSYENGLYGLPFLVHNEVLYYRTDLLEKAGLDKPPSTWDEYREYARKLTGDGVYGTLVRGKRDGEVAVSYLALLQQAGGNLVDDSGNVIFDDQPARDAFELMLGLVADKSAPPGLRDITDAQGLFTTGKLATVAQWPYMFPLSQDEKQSKVAGKVAVAPHPGPTKPLSTVFSWGFGVAASSKQQDAAWEWVKWSTSAAVLTRYGTTMINPVPRKSSLAKIQSSNDIDKRGQEAIVTFSESVADSPTMPMIPKFPDLQDILAVTVSDVMSGQATPDEAVPAAAEKMEQALAS